MITCATLRCHGSPLKLVGQEQTVQVIEMVLEWLQLVKDKLRCMSEMSALFAVELATKTCWVAYGEVKLLAEIWQNRSDAKLDPALSQRLVSLFKGAVSHTVKSGVLRVFRQDPPVIALERYTLDLMAEVFTDLYFLYPTWLEEWVQAARYDDRDMDVITKFGSERKMIAGECRTSAVYKHPQFNQDGLTDERICRSDQRP